MRERFKAYDEQTAPLLEYYRAQKKLFDIPSPTSKKGYAHIKNLLHDKFGQEPIEQ